MALTCALAMVATPAVARATQGEEPVAPEPITDVVVAQDVLPEGEDAAASEAVEEAEVEPKAEAPVRLTSFEIANGDIALDGIDAYQVGVPGTSLWFRANEGAEHEVTDVTISDERVADVHSYEGPSGMS